MADGSKDSVIAPAPTAASTSSPTSDGGTKPDGGKYKIAEIRGDGTIILLLEDDRMIEATATEGLALRKGSNVEIKSEGENKDGTPVNPVVTKLL